MINKTLPQYWDDEVREFHPFFENVMNEAIRELGLNEELEVVHHWTTKGFSGIIDFAICNKKSRKVLLPIEVKKSVNDLRAMGRRQCRGYLDALGAYRGSDYYLATNLEHVELFKDSPNRTLTLAQMLSLKNAHVGELKTSDFSDFAQGLRLALIEVLQVVRANDGSEYASNISGLLHALETSTTDIDSWHQAHWFYGYDYIRGALAVDDFFINTVSKWPPAALCHQKPEQIKAVTSPIDFDLLFEKEPKGRFNSQEILQIAEGAFSAGQSHDLGEDLSSVVNEIAHSIKGIPGAVETTSNLANLLVVQMAQVLGNRLYANMKIMEPGCGTGNLIVALKKFHKTLRASQIFGIEKEEIFREALSIRIGLNFKDSLRNGEKPNLQIRTLESLGKDECKDVGLVIMNPPFIRGIDCVEEKRKLSELILQNTGLSARLTGEQLGYECGYLEYLISLVPDQTAVAMIFPKNALLRPDSSDVREFLIRDFGLKQIVNYKDTNVFGSVQKSTTILIGIKGTNSKAVDYLNFHSELSEIDFGNLGNSIKSMDMAHPIFSKVEIEMSSLMESTKYGWKSLLSENESLYEKCIQEMLECGTFQTLIKSHNLYRGNMGNQGASDFIFNPKTPSSTSLASPPDKWKKLPKNWILPAVKNSDTAAREITSNSGESAIHLPESYLEIGTKEDVLEYLNEFELANDARRALSGPQRKKNKSTDDLFDILKSSNPAHGPLVLIPRGQRASAQISFSSEPEILVSTNFFIAECKSRSEAIVLSSWLLSIFGQIQFEHSGIDQEGMRKLERLQIGNCLIPYNFNFTEEELHELELMVLSTEPLVFKDVRTREIDLFWATKLSPGNGARILESIITTFQMMCNERLKS